MKTGIAPCRTDLVFASRSGETSIVGHREMWLRIVKLGDLRPPAAPIDAARSHCHGASGDQGQPIGGPMNRTGPIDVTA
jgi:hypothetical protein